MNIFVETILQDKIKELFDSGKFILIGSFENMDNERFCLSEKLKEDVSTRGLSILFTGTDIVKK